MDRCTHEKNSPNIYLIGFMGCGKTTISECLHKEYHKDQVEMDIQIQNEEGMAISQIFEEKGEEYFRELEARLLERLSNRENLVVSCGGGVPMRECNVKEMKKSGVVVLLLASPQTVYARIKDTHVRPLLEGNMNVGYIGELMAKRKDKYQAAADFTVNTDDRSVADICREIIEKVNLMERDD